MKWMNTKELVSLLKRFPNEEVEVVDYQDGSLASALFGMKADGEKCFRLTWDGETNTYSEAGVLSSYGNRYWKIVSSLFLRSEHERQIALRMVEELWFAGVFGRHHCRTRARQCASVRALPSPDGRGLACG